MATVAFAESNPTNKRNGAQFKTPTIQRVAATDATTPGASPTLRASFNFTSPSVPSANASVPLNDDEAEKRQRRLESKRKEFMSPGGHTPKNITSSTERRRQCTAGSQYTNVQIADHYKQCVKLSSENKINYKNAFGLHLIDYMADVLRRGGDITNFQVAGCTLDASAKIYAGRVDSIYNDAFKMLGGLGRGSKGREEGDQETADDECTADTVQKTKKKNRNRAASVQTVETNLKSLDVVTFDLEFEVDPLYKKTAAAFDEGGIEGLLLNQIHAEDDFMSLKLDPSGATSGTELPIAAIVPQPPLAAVMQEVDFQSRVICPTFASFTFQQADEVDNSWSRVRDKIPQTPASPPQTFHQDDDDDDPIDYQQNSSFAEGQSDVLPLETDDFPQENSTHTNLTSCQDGILGVTPAPGPAVGGEGQGRSVHCLTSVMEDSEYSYFKPDTLSAWAGPQFWKRRAAAPMTKSKKKDPRKAFRIDFQATLNESEFLPGKAAIQLSKLALAKMHKEQTTLPHDDKTEVSSLLRLFHNPAWTVKQLTHKDGQLDTEDDAANCYNYSNENDVNNFCPAFEYGGGDHDDDDNSSTLQETFVPFGNDTQIPDYDQTLSQPHATAFMGDNLIAQPTKVQPISIDYAKTAKKIDVKKVKGSIWAAIVKHNENQTSPLSFSSLCETVPHGLSESARKNLSIPICFVCLLHLANEKNLSIAGDEDMSELYIRCAPQQ